MWQFTVKSLYKFLLNFSSRNLSNVLSERRLLCGRKISPPALKSRSTGAEDGRVVLYLMKRRSRFLSPSNVAIASSSVAALWYNCNPTISVGACCLAHTKLKKSSGWAGTAVASSWPPAAGRSWRSLSCRYSLWSHSVIWREKV